MDDRLAGHTMYFPQYRKGRSGLPTFEGTILDHARKLGVEISAECGGKGTCGACVVRIEKGAEALSPPTDAERQLDLESGERLACQAKITQPGDVYVFIKSAGRYSILSDTVRRDVVLEPFVEHEDGRVVWNGTDQTGKNLASGIYIARLSSPGKMVNMRLFLAR